MTSLRERLRGSSGGGGGSEDDSAGADSPGGIDAPNVGGGGGGGSDDGSDDSGGGDDGPRTDRGEPSIPNTGGGGGDGDDGGSDDSAGADSPGGIDAPDVGGGGGGGSSSSGGSGNGGGSAGGGDDQDLVDQGPGKEPLTEEEVAEQQRRQERERQREEQLEELREITDTQGGRVAILEGAAEKLDERFPEQDIERDEVQVSFEDGTIGLAPDARKEVAAEQAGVEPSAIRDVEETDDGLEIEFTEAERKRRAAEKIENQLIEQTPGGSGAGQARELREDVNVEGDQVEFEDGQARLEDDALLDIVASRSSASENELRITETDGEREVVVDESVVASTGDDAARPEQLGGPADARQQQARIKARQEFREQLSEESDLPSEVIGSLDLESEQQGQSVSVTLSDEGEETLARNKLEQRIEERTGRDVDPEDIVVEETEDGGFTGRIAEGTFPQEELETDVEARGGLAERQSVSDEEPTRIQEDTTLRGGATALAGAGAEVSERIGDVGGGFVGEGVESAAFAIPTGPTSGEVTTLEEISGETDTDRLTDTDPETGAGQAAEEAVTGGALGTVGLASSLPLTGIVAGETALEAADFATENPPRESAEAAVGAGEAFAQETIKSARENKARTAGSFVGATTVLGVASAVGPRASLAARGVIQPGEELLGYGGNRAVGAVSQRAARRTFPNNEPLIFSEEAAIRTVSEAGSRARSAAATVRERAVPSDNRGQLTPADLLIRSESESESETGSPELDDALERFERATRVREAEARAEQAVRESQAELRAEETSPEVTPDLSNESPGPDFDPETAAREFTAGSRRSESGPTQRQQEAFQSSFESDESDLSPRERQLEAQETETETTEETTAALEQRLEEASTPFRRTESATVGEEEETEEVGAGVDSELRSAVEERPGELGRAETGEVTDLRTLFEVRSEQRSELGTELGTELRTEAETDTELETELEAETETEGESEFENELETEFENEFEQELETETETEFETEFEQELEFENETELEAENENDPDPSRTVGVGGGSSESERAAFEGDLTSGFFNEFVSQLAGVDRSAPGDEQLEEIAGDRVTNEALPTAGQIDETEEFEEVAGFFSGEGTGLDFEFGFGDDDGGFNLL